MLITLWYQSHNPHERAVAHMVSAYYPDARLVDASTWTARREVRSESGWPDRHVRAFPCLVLDTDDGAIELERVEGVVDSGRLEDAVARAKVHMTRLPAAMAEARQRDNVPGGARPKRIAELRPAGELRSTAP